MHVFKPWIFGLHSALLKSCRAKQSITMSSSPWHKGMLDRRGFASFRNRIISF
jgi:hypothetical protein